MIVSQIKTHRNSDWSYFYCNLYFIVAPEVEWVIPNITIPEGNNETVCFMTNIGTATPYDVVISTHPKGQNPALSKIHTAYYYSYNTCYWIPR